MTKERFADIAYWMRDMPVATALNWCESEMCACMGCVNGSGGLERHHGVTKEEWREWWRRATAEFQKDE
jgi:hypothetical protein